MATQADKLGPGKLIFGEPGDPQEFSSQITKAELTPEYDSDDDIPVLDGGVVAGDETDTYTMAGEFLQDYSSMKSLLVWCKRNSGKVMPFEFVPKSDGALHVKGQVKIRAVKLGGDVKKTNTTEFEFPGVGDWDFVDPAETSPASSGSTTPTDPGAVG